MVIWSPSNTERVTVIDKDVKTQAPNYVIESAYRIDNRTMAYRFKISVDKIEKHCNMDTKQHTHTHTTHEVHTMSMVMTRVPFHSYIAALNCARDTDERIVNSLSTPADLTAKVQDYYRQVAKVLRRPLRVEELFHGDHVIARVAYQGTKPMAGYLIVGGELVGLFSLARGRGDWLMEHAVSDGADHLDCFAEPALLKLYHRHGFTITHSIANWDATGLPVVYMRR